MVNTIVVGIAIVVLIGLGFSAVIFGLPFIILVFLLLFGLTLLVWIVVKALKSLSTPE